MVHQDAGEPPFRTRAGPILSVANGTSTHPRIVPIGHSRLGSRPWLYLREGYGWTMIPAEDLVRVVSKRPHAIAHHQSKPGAQASGQTPRAWGSD